MTVANETRILTWAKAPVLARNRRWRTTSVINHTTSIITIMNSAALVEDNDPEPAHFVQVRNWGK
jgi:hypothetical protein